MSQGLADVSATLRRCHMLTSNAMDADIFGSGHVVRFTRIRDLYMQGSLCDMNEGFATVVV